MPRGSSRPHLTVTVRSVQHKAAETIHNSGSSFKSLVIIQAVVVDVENITSVELSFDPGAFE